MNKICTIGFTKKTLPEFIRRLKEAGVQRIIDVRLNDSSQLAGFAISSSLEYILQKDEIEYVSVKALAPDKALLKKYRKDNNWDKYEVKFKELMTARNAKEILKKLNLDEKVSCFLCSEDKPDKCHRRLVAEMLKNDFEIVHL